jgi:hypothetical protein
MTIFVGDKQIKCRRIGNIQINKVMLGLVEIFPNIIPDLSDWLPTQLSNLLFWIDPSDMSTMFQDAAGTIPVTALNQPVGLIKDKSGNNRHLTQATASQRPSLQARLNMVAVSENIVAANALFQLELDYTQNQPGPFGKTNASKLVPTAVSNQHIYGPGMYTPANLPGATVCSITGCFKASGYGKVLFKPDLNRAGGCTFDLSSGTLATAQNAELDIVGSMVDVGDGFYRCTVKGTVETSNGRYSAFQILNASGQANFVGDGTSGVIVWGLQVQLGAFTTYQASRSATDYDDVGAPRYLQGDGSDDNMVFAGSKGTSWLQSLTGNTAHSTFIAASFDNNSKIQTLFGTNNGTNVGGGLNHFRRGANSPARMEYEVYGDPTPPPLFSLGVDATSKHTYPYAIVQNYDTANTPDAFYMVNGVKVREVDKGATSPSLTNASGYDLMVFNMGVVNSTYAMNGRIYQFFARSSGSTTEEVAAANKFLAKKSGAIMS